MASKAPFHAPVITDDKPEEAVLPGYVPEGFKDVDEFLKYARECYQEDVDYDKDNREAALDDLKFLAMDQWDPEVRAAREAAGKPCVSVNVLNQFVAQVIGDRRINKTSIRVRPKLDATMQMAEARSGIIKSIEEHSRAERVYDAAMEDQVSCGVGNMRINLDWADDDIFLQDIFIKPVPNPLAVVWDRMSVDPTGRDASRCFVIDSIPVKEYEKAYPDARKSAEFGSDLSHRIGWFENNSVRVCEFWEMKYRKAIIALMGDGSTQDVTGKDVAAMIAAGEIVTHPVTQMPMIREGSKAYAQMHLITGWEILAGPYELPLNRLPVVRVMGREVRVGDDRVRFGLVRFSKDAQRMKNYWRSVAVEKLAMAPKSVWMAQASSVEGREEDFRNAHLSNDPLLIYNDQTDKPDRLDAPAMDSAILQEVAMNQQDIKDTTGLHDASLGIRSNEISGKAIMARQQEGDVATIIYHDNLNAAIGEVGDVVNQLIPVAYDTIRSLRVIGMDEKDSIQTFNDPNDPQSIDLTKGKFQVSIETGPSYTTQRMYAAEAMMEAVKVNPQLMMVAGDLLVKAQDWPGAFEIAERLKKTMPQEIIADEKELTPEEQQAAAEAQAAAQEEAMKQKAFTEEMATLELELKREAVKKAKHETRKADAEADMTEAEADIKEIEAEAAGPKAAAEIMSLKSPEQQASEEEARQGSGGPRPAGGRTAQRKKSDGKK